MEDVTLQTIWQQRQFDDRIAPLGQPLAFMMKHVLAKRVRQLGKLAGIWDSMIPDSIRDHTALEGLNRGVLTVMVDSASHRYQLQKLLTGGLMKVIRERFAGPLDKIRIIPGQFCSVDLAGSARYDF